AKFIWALPSRSLPKPSGAQVKCKARGKANEISKFPDDTIHKTRLLAGPSRRLPKPSGEST
ncbi:hypothetical protein, partial [uncultured Alistipes sp.]